MSTIRNKVQLIGNVGNAPEVRNLDSGKKVASFSIATNEFFKNSKGEKVQNDNYVYYLEYINGDNQLIELTGVITLVR